MNNWTPPSDVQPRVVCAACKLSDGSLIAAPRHWDSTMRAVFLLLTGYHTRPHDSDSQGFIDQWGRYMSRTEAWKVAEAAGQILHRCGGDTADGGTLYSENLY